HPPCNLDALDHGLVDIGRLVDRASEAQDFPVIAEVRARPHAARHGAGLDRRGRDLVLEVVVEGRHVDAGAGERIPVDRRLVVDARLWLEVWVADEWAGSLPAETADAVIKVVRLGG